MTHPPILPPQPRRLGAVNWLGLWTLYVKEVRRFLKVHFQTIWAPVVTTLMFMAVFSLALGARSQHVGQVGYLEFLAPGLIMMAMMQNAFANTSSSLIIAKVQGNIVDLLMPPLTATELTLAIAAGGVTRGLVVGGVVAVVIAGVVDLGVHSMAALLYFGIAASLMLSLLGMLGGIWADKFDHMAAVTNFIITPLSFLSGTFYSVDRLAEPWRQIAKANPFFHLIDGFRYGFIGHAEGNLMVGAVVVAVVDAGLLWVIYWMIRTGYKLRP